MSQTAVAFITIASSVGIAVIVSLLMIHFRPDDDNDDDDWKGWA